HAAAARHGALRELIDPALQEFLIGAKVGQFVRTGCWKACQQCDCCGQTSDRRHPPDIPLCGHRSPEKSTVATSRMQRHPFLSRHNRERAMSIKRALPATWSFRRSVAALQHISLTNWNF